MAGLTKALCEKVAGIATGSIPAEAFVLANQAILDTLAAGVAGAGQIAPRILAQYVEDEGCAPQASVIGFGFKTSLARAALVNGASMHVLDYEPMANPANHPVSSMLPGILALAESRGLDGREIVTALILGYEMQSRLRIATGRAGKYLLHTPVVVGAMGGAVAAGYLLRLTSEQLRHALGMAASRAGGLHANAGSMTKCTHLGWAASHGLESALLAERGFEANPNIIEAHKGFAAALLDGEIVEDIVLGFGDPYLMVRDRFAIKLFPAPYPTHWGMDAALRLHARLESGDEIASVLIDMPPLVMIDRPQPASAREAVFSTQYTVTCALLDGQIRIDHFTDKTFGRADISALLPRIRVSMDAERPTDGDERWVRVEVTTASGKVLTERCDKPEGHYLRPPLSMERHLVKLNDCFDQAFGPDERDHIIGLCARLDTCSAAEVADLIQRLGRRGIST